MSKRSVAAVIVLLVVCAHQPSTAEPTWEVGILGGLNLSAITGDTQELASASDPDGFVTGDVKEANPGIVGGGFAMVNITELFGLRVEGLASMKGGKGDVEGTVFGTDFTGTATFSLLYIEVPFLATFSVPAGETVLLRALVGGAFASLADAEFTLEIEAMGQKESQTFSADEIFKKPDFGGVIGAEVSFEVGTVNVLLDARWTLGFSNIADDPSGSVSLKNNGISLMAGLGFPIGA